MGSMVMTSEIMESYQKHILVVDDDKPLRELLKKFLCKQGFRVTTAANAAIARKFFQLYEFDLLILDVMMPGETGMDLTLDMRQTNTTPILMLTAMAEAGARIKGLRAGADDYLAKPFEPEELLLRTHAILRRTQPTLRDSAHIVSSHDKITLGDAIFDLDRAILTKGKDVVRLTSAESALLRVMATQQGRIFSREALTKACAITGGDRAIDVQVTRLRRKIEHNPKNPHYLQTIRGRGYVLHPD